MSKSKNKPLISIIMPCYCCADTVTNTVESVMEQTWTSTDKKTKVKDTDFLELIAIDDGSDDNGKTIKILDALKNKYSNLKVISLKNNVGQAQARNKAIKQANGKYLGFVDADDKVDSNLFITINKALSEHKKPDIVCWGTTEYHYDNKGQLVKKIEIIPDAGYYTKKNDITKVAIKLEEQVLLGYLWNKLFKKKMVKNNKIELPDEHLIEDILFNIYCFQEATSLLCINKSMYDYQRRQDANNTVTTSYLPDYFDQYSKRIQELVNWLKKQKCFDEDSRKILANYYVRYALSAVWRNSDKKSKMSHKQRKQWLTNFFDLPLSKELIKYSIPKGKIAKINSFLFKHKLKALIMAEAKLVDVTNRKLSKILIKARQSR